MTVFTSQTILQAHNLSKQVTSGDTSLHILQDINLSINYADSIAIVGRSGSGKSTLLGLLAGLDFPSSGQITFNGQAFSSLDEDSRAKLRAGNVSFIFQSFHLIPSLTALENVMLPLELINFSQPRQQAITLLEQVGLAQRQHHYPNQLSGGEQQRVAIARAFACRPKILFADELTGNLDKETGQQIISLLFALNTHYQTTLVLVTHDELLASHCQRKITLEGGRIIAAC